MAFGYVYIMSNGNEYKIGLTGSEPEKRRAALNTASASRVDLVGYVLCKDMEALEAKLHREFMHNRKNGEWFDMNDSDLSKVLSIFKEESINDSMSLFPDFKNVGVKKMSLAESIRASKIVTDDERFEFDLKKVKNNKKVCKHLMLIDFVRSIYFNDAPLYESAWREHYSEKSEKFRSMAESVSSDFDNGDSPKLFGGLLSEIGDDEDEPMQGKPRPSQIKDAFWLGAKLHDNGIIFRWEPLTMLTYDEAFDGDDDIGEWRKQYEEELRKNKDMSK